MSLIILSNETISIIENEISSLDANSPIFLGKELECLDVFLDNTKYPGLHFFKKAVLALVLDTGYCHVKGIPSHLVRSVSVVLGHTMGFMKKQKAQNSYFSHFKMSNNPSHDSESLKPLPFHTDFSVEDIPPRIGIITCIQQDMGIPEYGCTLLYDLNDALDSFKYLGVLEELETTLFPFVRPAATDPREILNSPILTNISIGKNHRYMVRFQRGVVARGFELSSKKPTEKQHQLIKVFLEEIMKYEIRIPLATGEILTFDNHRVPHARTRGSILLKETTIVGREFLTGFVQGLRKD